MSGSTEVAAPRFGVAGVDQNALHMDLNNLSDLFFSTGEDDLLFSGLDAPTGAPAADKSAEDSAAGGKNDPPKKKRKTERERERSLEQVEKRRERNRILARRTRLRKKFFFESLQRQVVELQRENAMLKDVVKKHLEPDQAGVLLASCNTEVPDIVNDSATKATETLQKSDYQLMKVLTSAQQSFVVTDPQLPDNPIVYASAGFMELTGYTQAQVLGRNCRFLQGPDTDPKKVSIIRSGIAAGVDTSVCLLNYKADGTPFWNQFFIAALRDVNRRVVNFVGVQCELEKPPPDDEEFMAALEARRAMQKTAAEMHYKQEGGADGDSVTA
uniref:LOV domain-containing protein n=1 Tax=Phaeomonas parva TaxID=124430 RepID=A0A7S1UD67_9STRA|mmetsp:Transcript_40838/g.127909  ORF Transcript_40838/g.127909 Transcript_40838/m.127909 type:complete len:328 (+) Transcript_40838:254-1237(+)|eukprot:CAMPEP_0118849950 /NCGR_PEP_ID=MMETSP1163-20130328/36_1 /TAXON_ID=124430 /ORGANISM="Phaeomonas parva, Strain CCMP2877" /LENGTH=327 /DNA_ID=CAMNT_0006782143 /DNA_START=291 /DNA_END=1274 /DNA_ORIENTATION=+